MTVKCVSHLHVHKSMSIIIIFRPVLVTCKSIEKSDIHEVHMCMSFT